MDQPKLSGFGKVKIEVKEEKDVRQGSLGTLFSSYADSSDSGSSEDEDVKPPQPQVLPQAPPVIINVVRTSRGGGVTVKREGGLMEVEEEASDDEDWTVQTSIKIKEEPQDFASIREQVKVEGEIELDVEDFLEESYVEARPVKLEVSSGTEDSEGNSDDTGEKSSEDEEEEGSKGSKQGKGRKEAPKVKGEMGFEDLPPIEDLHISVPHEECKPIGVIRSVVDPLVIVEAHPETPALNLDSVLFLDEGDRALGHVFDVIGPVSRPLYCVRFNSKEHIEKNKVEVGMSVYCAPNTPYTTFVFLAQLKKLRGSDASWVNDIEPPQEEVEFSDEEMERIAKKKKKKRRQRTRPATEEDAMDKEGLPEKGFQRGQKRGFNNQNKGQGPSHLHPPRPRSPFVPAIVPGFVPPWMMLPHQQRNRFPKGPPPPHFPPRHQFRQRRGAHHPRQHFHQYQHEHPHQQQTNQQFISPSQTPPHGPPLPPDQMSFLYPFQGEGRPWLPPLPQHQFPQRPPPPNFNFSGYNNYPPQNFNALPQRAMPPPPPPPPPPPVPGE